MALHFDTRSDGARLVELDPITDEQLTLRVEQLAADPSLDDEDIIEAVCCELYGSDWLENELIERAVVACLEGTERALPALKAAA